jgi:nicotinate-nucleotide--dimethylbenzimidazole phosphoribosyltransferase
MSAPVHLAGALDGLEGLLAAIRAPAGPAECAVTVAAGDHGIARHGVSRLRYGDSLSVLRIVASRRSPVARLCRAFDLDLHLLNVGCAEVCSDSSGIDSTCHVQSGAGDISTEPAMCPAIAERLFGMADSLVATLGATCLCLGEVGIGNTTSAACLTSQLLDRDLAQTIGSGSGVEPGALERKRHLAAAALQRHRASGVGTCPLNVLASLGGLEIAWNVGVVLAAHRSNRRVLLDGFISSVAGLVAARIEPSVRRVLLATHVSSEPGHRLVLDALGLRPFLDLRLGLGQGFGAALGYVFLQSVDRAVFAAASPPKVCLAR